MFVPVLLILVLLLFLHGGSSAASPAARCVFLHGAGYNHSAPPSSVDIGQYWGGADNVRRLVPACPEITFLHYDMLSHGWDEEHLAQSVCKDLLAVQGHNAFGSGDSVVRRTHLVSHSMGNNVFANALRRGFCSLDAATSTWTTLSPPWEGSQAASWVGRICDDERGIFHWFSEKLGYCDPGTQRLYPSWSSLQTTVGDLESGRLRDSVRGNISAAACGVSAFGIPSRFSVELAALSLAVDYGENNDAMVGIASCQLPGVSYSSNWNRTRHYVGKINHADATLRNGDGDSAAKAPAAWLNTVIESYLYQQGVGPTPA